MNALYDLKDMLCSQLEEYGKRGEMSSSVLEKVDMLAHAIKNLDRVIECYDGDSYEFSNNSNRSYRRSNNSSRGGSRARRNSWRGGSYSDSDGMVDQLYEMMENAPDEQTRQEIQKLVTKMEQM